MLGNSWYKKEMPLLGLLGLGGGAGGYLVGGGPAFSPVTATGGYIHDFEDGSKKYRAHIFINPGSFVVTDGGADVEYLLVAGGGGGGGNSQSGGGGAGGLRTNLAGVVDASPSPLTISDAFPVAGTPGSPKTYPIVIGRGGWGGPGAPQGPLAAKWQAEPTGENSTLSDPTNTPQNVVATGGGGSMGYNPPGPGGFPGGSGGGADNFDPSQGVPSPGAANFHAGLTVASPDGLTPTQQGFPGGGAGTNYGSPYTGAGGGGAGAAGGPDAPPVGSSQGKRGNGGNGVQVLICGPDASGIGDCSSAPNGNQWFAGGGGAGGWDAGPIGTGGLGGGHPGYPNASGAGGNGKACTGGGGGGASGPNPGSDWYDKGGNGGPGICIVRYEVDELGGTAKATGGAISFWSNPASPTGKTAIHTFFTPGSFINTTPATYAVETVVVGGGAGSGGGLGGGGGAGKFLYTPSTPVASGAPNATSIVVGNGGPGGSWNGAGPPGNSGALPSTAGDANFNGMQSSFGGLSAPGGGAGGGYDAGGEWAPVGSAGGGSGAGSHPGGTGGQGDGGTGSASGNRGGGGGGGSGGNGGPGGAGGGGSGGVGTQVPASFQSDVSQIGFVGPGSPGTGYDWFAGGGIGGADGGSAGGGGAPDGNSWAGAAGGDCNSTALSAFHGSGSGAGGGGNAKWGGNGGSGIVLVAYPA